MNSQNLETIKIDGINFQLFKELDSAFMQKMRCFVLAKDFQNLQIAIDKNFYQNAQISESSTLFETSALNYYLNKKFPTLQIRIYFVENFDFFFNLALTHAQFFELSKDLAQKLSSLHSPNAANTDDSEVLQLLDFILLHAVQNRSSDIHFEQNGAKCVVRNRIDGLLSVSFELERAIFDALTTRLKLDCKLDISEFRKSQDGRFSRTFPQLNNREFDFRFSSMPSISGQSVVLRILEKSRENLALCELGFLPKSLQIIQANLQKSSGVVLLVGPTGCGKSTTLHAMLSHINDASKKIITIEDPIEYTLQGVTQVVLNQGYGFGFESALRGILRQDPDVIMIGEIRDSQTLEMVLQASLTGHLVFATLHANDTISAMDRILSLGGKPEILSQSLSLIIAQRLVRKLCKHCKVRVDFEFYKDFENGIYWKFLQNLQNLGANFDLYRADGCVYCAESGVNGRVMMAELLGRDEFLQRLNGVADSQKLADSENFLDSQKMLESIKNLLENGVCSLEEICRVWS